MTAPARIKKDDVKRVVAGVIEGGMLVGRVEYENGKLVILSAAEAEADPIIPARKNPLDRLLVDK